MKSVLKFKSLKLFFLTIMQIPLTLKAIKVDGVVCKIIYLFKLNIALFTMYIVTKQLYIKCILQIRDG